MSDFYSLTDTELCDRLCEAEHPLVVIHTRPDGDAVGSGAALCLLFEKLGKHATLLCADSIPKRLAFLVQGIDLTPPQTEQARCTVTIDIAAPEQLGALKNQLIGPLLPRLMIDHHATGTPFCDYLLLSDAAASGEIVWHLVGLLEKKLNRCLADKALASAVYAAISSDTGCFRFSNTTPNTLRVAAELLKYGVDNSEINRLLFDCKSRSQIQAEGMTAERLCYFAQGRIACASFSLADMKENGLSVEDFETAIDVVRSAEGAEIACVVKETEDGRYRVSFRSTGADVAALAASYGGGGHRCAAGCTIDADSPVDAIKKLVPFIEKALV